jgi:pyruvate dehydrogenase E1 component
LAFLAAVHGVPSALLGVSGYGQSGSLAEVYRYHGIDSDAVVRAALDLAE